MPSTPSPTSTKQSTLAAAVMRRIEDKEVAMKPRLYFAVAAVLVAALSVVSGLLLAYVMSMGYFWLRIVTADTMAYGARRNLSQALADFPWWLLALAVALAAISLWVVRKHSRLYRYPVATLLATFLFLSALCSLGFSILGIGQQSMHSSTPQTNHTTPASPGRRHHPQN